MRNMLEIHFTTIFVHLYLGFLEFYSGHPIFRYTKKVVKINSYFSSKEWPTIPQFDIYPFWKWSEQCRTPPEHHKSTHFFSKFTTFKNGNSFVKYRIYFVALAWLHSLECIHLVAFTWLHSLSYIHLVTFMWLHSHGHTPLLCVTLLYSLACLQIHAISTI